MSHRNVCVCAHRISYQHYSQSPPRRPAEGRYCRRLLRSVVVIAAARQQGRHLSRAESDICPELGPTCSSGHDRSLDRDLTVTLSSENRHRYVANHRPFFKMPPPGPWSALVSLTLSTLPYLAVTVRWGPESGASRLSTEPVRCRRLARESVWTSSCCS